jgi:hypothetical protein
VARNTEGAAELIARAEGSAISTPIEPPSERGDERFDEGDGVVHQYAAYTCIRQ